MYARTALQGVFCGTFSPNLRASGGFLDFVQLLKLHWIRQLVHKNIGEFLSLDYAIHLKLHCTY
jgi:hypothetical protein